MGAIADRLGPLITAAELKTWLRIDDDIEDDLVDQLKTSILDMADIYCNNPFQDSSGNDLPIPESVRVWLYREMSRVYELRTAGMEKNETSELGRQEIFKPVNWSNVEWGPLRMLRFIPGF
ncbi:MAG: head-tail connector protein [Candidatus Riesia sp.]|nr:head-tail connector protein [Candidatus Riesia sp.]